MCKAGALLLAKMYMADVRATVSGINQQVGNRQERALLETDNLSLQKRHLHKYLQNSG